MAYCTHRIERFQRVLKGKNLKDSTRENIAHLLILRVDLTEVNLERRMGTRSGTHSRKFTALAWFHATSQVETYTIVMDCDT